MLVVVLSAQPAPATSLQALRNRWQSDHGPAAEFLAYLSDDREVPGPPGVPFVSDTGRNWVTLSWSKPQPRGSTLMVAPVLAYRVDAWNTEEARWTELGVTPVNSMDVFNLKGEYRFRVTGRNRYGWGEGVTNVNPINIEGDLQMPEFVQDLPGQLKALLGHSVQLKCRVKGIPDPEIKWYRNGMDVSGRKECRWTEKRKGDACYLSCEEVCLEDEGRYRCEAANTLGRVATFARLQVVTDPKLLVADTKLKRRLSEVEAEFGPQFTMRLRDRRVQLGHPVRLTCQIVASPPPQVVWTKDGQPIASTDGHVITSSSDGFHTLEITRATEEDGGEYCVSGKNEHGCLGCRAQLTVDKGLRGYIAPAFVSQVECVTAAAGVPPHTATVLQGSELRLRARVEAYPSIGISWEKDGVRLRPSRRRVMTVDGEGSVELAVAGVQLKEAGVYTCTAHSPVGRATTSCNVTVITDTQLTTHTTLTPPVPYCKAPLFVTKPRSSEAVEGETVVIMCEVVGDPKPEVIWLRDWLKPEYYRDAPQFRLVGDSGPEYRLEIPQVKLDFTGAYSVIARNTHGEAKAVISLQIYAKGQGREETMDSGSIKQGKVETLPLVTRPLKDLRCCDGDAVVFECRVKASPQPDIRWEKDGKLVKMDGDFKSDQDGETASLSIGRVYPEDEGEYTCIAYNRLGKATTSACLIVDVPEEKESLVNQKLSKPSCLGSAGSTPRSTPGTTPTRSVSPCVTRSGHTVDSALYGVKRSSRRLKTSSPKFYSVPHNKVVEEGETVRIQCSAAGHPSPWSTWDKDGILVSPSARIRIAERDDLRYLEITEVTAEDAGLYRVTLENEYGRVEATARLDVIGRNGRRPRAVRAWSAPRCVPSFTRRLIGSTAQVGGTFSLACDIHAAPPPVTSWYRNGELLVRSDRVIPTWDGRTARLEVENVTVEDSGVYTCVADSPMGSTRCSARLRVIETDDPGDADLRPPVVVAGLPEETAAQEGRPYELQIRVKGSEPMEVVWVKDKVEVPDCDDMRYVDYGDGRYGLRIADLFAPDAGEYSCEIFNEHGEAITTTNLTVIDDGFSEDNIELRPQALWFTRTPAPLTTSCGGSAKFSARVSWLGPNAPIFKWEVGSNPVTLQSHRFKVTNCGEETFLEMKDLEAKDSGLVRCTAKWCGESHAGDEDAFCAECLSASCSAELTVGQGTALKTPARLVTGPADTTALRGDRVLLKAVYSGTPEPTVRWLKAGKNLTSSHRVMINTSDGVSCLVLDPVMADDSGKYVITVQNPHGSDCHFASVAVEGCPDPPAGVPSVSLAQGGGVTVAWCSPPYDGGAMITGYSVEMTTEEQDNSWTVVADRCHCLSHTVSDLTPGLSYTFRVRSHNIHGPSEPGLYSTPIEIGSSEEEVSSLGEHKIVDVRPGEQFKEIYNVGEELGKGRYGVVHKVTDRKSGVKMAAKFVRCIKKQDREKVFEEIDIMNCLRHPKLLQLADAFENPRDIVMVMEYISGGELFERVVADDFTLTEKDCILFMRQICEGVDYMHKNRIVHLDLKPENIMCQTRTSHQIKLIDFGLAQKLKPDTPVRVLFGTPEFIPPEIINYEPIGTETDMWSVGVICYVLLSGLSPFMGDNDAETFANITRADYDFDDEAFDSICQDAKDFISALLVNRKEKRLSAEECLRHRWMTQQDIAMNKVRLCTDKLKKFIIRRKWQKTGNAIRALGRMATLSAASRRNSSNGGGGGGGSPRPSLGSRMSSLGETSTEDESGSGPGARPRACSERSDSGISDCSSLPSSVSAPLLFGKKFSISEEAEVQPEGAATRAKTSAHNGVPARDGLTTNSVVCCSAAGDARPGIAGRPPLGRSPLLTRDARMLTNSDNVQKAFAFWKR